MTKAGSFVSEAFACGSNYYFSAQFNRFLWAAQITTSMGFPLISISCTPPRSSLCIESVEDALAEWVYQTLCSHLQVVVSSAEMTTPVMEAAMAPLYPAASNAPIFCSWSPAREQAFGSVKIRGAPKIDAESLKNLKDMSAAAIKRFEDVAVDFDEYRTRMHSLLEP